MKLKINTCLCGSLDSNLSTPNGGFMIFSSISFSEYNDNAMFEFKNFNIFDKLKCNFVELN